MFLKLMKNKIFHRKYLFFKKIKETIDKSEKKSIIILALDDREC